MNRSGNTGFNGLVFFGNRGDGLFLLEQDSPECGRSSVRSAGVGMRWFEPRLKLRWGNLNKRYQDSPEHSGRSKRKSRQGAGCEVVCLKANREL